MKIFGSTRYVKVQGEYKDVNPNEKFLQLDVKSQWDWNLDKKFLAYKGDFCYYVVLAAKDTDSSYTLHKRLTDKEMTKDYLNLVNDYLDKK